MQLVAALLAAQALAQAQPHGVTLRETTFEGRKAVELTPIAGAAVVADETLAIVPGPAFHEGEIEVRVAADAMPGAAASIRAFAGLAFRLKDKETYEAFYLRMKNGRAHDQIQRNHAVQYVAQPAFPWERLRKETPGVYETYVDLVPRRWTTMRLRVCGTEARLFVDGASQPTLVVHDLKHGADAKGAVALWVGPATIGWFSDLRIKSEPGCLIEP